VRIVDFCFAAFLGGLCACTDGEGAPFAPVPEAGGGGSYDARSAGQAAAGFSAAAGRGAAGAAGSGGERRPLTKECQQLDSPMLTERDERLISLFNELRESPKSCGHGRPISKFERDEALQCMARMRFGQSGASRSMPGTPSVTAEETFGPNWKAELRDRALRAGVWGGVVEVTVSGAESAEAVLNSISEATGTPEMCDLVRAAAKIGVAHVGTTWVMDFGWPSMNSPAHSGPMPGDH
jgi:hypothetical protein